jgi:hypothetical protein
MHILFETIRVNCKHGTLITYEQRLHACSGTRLYSHSAASNSCQQHLPDDPYKDVFPTY